MWWQYLGYLGKLSEHPACLECLHSFECISRVFKVDEAISFGRAETRKRRGGRRRGRRGGKWKMKKGSSWYIHTQYIFHYKLHILHYNCHSPPLA